VSDWNKPWSAAVGLGIACGLASRGSAAAAKPHATSRAIAANRNLFRTLKRDMGGTLLQIVSQMAPDCAQSLKLETKQAGFAAAFLNLKSTPHPEHDHRDAQQQRDC